MGSAYRSLLFGVFSGEWNLNKFTKPSESSWEEDEIGSQTLEQEKRLQITIFKVALNNTSPDLPQPTKFWTFVLKTNESKNEQ
jgi:hypothetical protein